MCVAMQSYFSLHVSFHGMKGELNLLNLSMNFKSIGISQKMIKMSCTATTDNLFLTSTCKVSLLADKEIVVAVLASFSTVMSPADK